MHQQGRKLFGWHLVVLLLAAGCQGGEEELAPVEGKVYLHGAPLAGGTIVFSPDPERGGNGPLAWGEIQADGSYTLKTGERDGAVPGWHCVTIAAGAQPSGLSPRYMDPEQSGQHWEVKPGQANQIEIHLE